MLTIIRWQERRNGVTGLEKEHIGYENGVLGGLMSALAAVCARGDNVLVHSPTYIGFTRSIENGGYHVITSPLKPDRYGVQRMDFFDMETKIKRNDIRAVVFCSPHNPTGRVWEQEELEQFMDMARRLNVTVISDEIWSDLTLRGHRHIPLQSVSDDARQRTVALYAPSKTFNLAGLIGSYHIVYNETLHKRMKKESSLSHYNSMNVLSIYARYVRAATIQQLSEDYVLFAISKGASRGYILLRHVLKNCLLPVITLVGMNLGSLVSGAYIVETIFGWPGLGTTGMSAIYSRDYNMIMGTTMLSCLLLVGGNLLADLCYCLADPRIKAMRGDKR